MVKLLNRFLLFSVIFFSIAITLTPKAIGITATFDVCGTNTADPCANRILQHDCTPPSILCLANPWCSKYTGNQCCTSFYNNDTGRMDGLGYNDCFWEAPSTGSDFNWPLFCPLSQGPGGLPGGTNPGWRETIVCSTYDCNAAISCSGSCISNSPNTCSNNGTRGNCVYTQYIDPRSNNTTGVTSCIQHPALDQVCSVNNCSTCKICQSGTCVADPSCLTPPPTPIPIPTCTYLNPGSNNPNDYYSEVCKGSNGTFTDNCGNKLTNVYLCSTDGLNTCNLTPTPCQPNETCIVQPDGKPVCIPGPTPIPGVCRVTTSPNAYNFTLGGTVTGQITATVTGIPAGKTFLTMLFGSDNTAVVNVNPLSDSASPYQTMATGLATGNTAVRATAELTDNATGATDTTTCQSATITNITVVTPTPTSTPTPTPGGLPNGSACTNNSQCFSGYCNPTTGRCQTPPTYSISGKIFNDVNSDTKSVGDSNYTGAFSVSLTGGTVSYPAPAGNYLISSLPSGQYTVTFGGLAGNYRFTYPPNNLGYSLTVNVGTSCSFPITSEASCSLGTSGSIANLNAGVVSTITSALPWIQSVGSDLRLDNGFSSAIPSGKYASVPGTGGMPGIIFSGKTSPSFGLGQASQNQFNWQVGSFSNPELFTTSHSIIPTSYNFLSETAQGSGINPATAAINNSLSHGIYKIDGNLNINAPVTFGTGNFIILINGNLNINANITVLPGSTVIFSAFGITVGSNVTEIEGLYSADGNFTVNGAGGCPGTPDSQLNVAGSVIANAGRHGGTFVNNRNLCGNNSTLPSVTFTERPDFMLNYPSMVKQIPRSWQEL